MNIDGKIIENVNGKASVFIVPTYHCPPNNDVVEKCKSECLRGRELDCVECWKHEIRNGLLTNFALYFDK